VTPYLACGDAAGAIDFYKKAFGASEVFRMAAPGGRIGHAEVKIGDSRIMLTAATAPARWRIRSATSGTSLPTRKSSRWPS